MIQSGQAVFPDQGREGAYPKARICCDALDLASSSPKRPLVVWSSLGALPGQWPDSKVAATLGLAQKCPADSVGPAGPKG